MADTKISALTAATTPLAGTEVLPIVQSSTTKKVAVSDLTAGRSVSAASLSLTTTPLAVTSGGTGLATLAQGDLLYGSASNTLSALAKNTTATRYLANTGTSNNPAWAQVDLTNGVTGTLPVGNGGSGTSTAFTAGSVVFAGTSGVYSQDNANLFWDDSNNRLGVGINSSLLSTLHVNGQARISGVSAGSTALVIVAGDILSDVSSGAFAIGNYGNSSSEMRISTRGFTTFRTGATDGTNGTEAMRIHASRGVSIGNTTDPGANNLYVTGTGKFGTTVGVGAATPAASGAGITFPATQSASSDANTLDDYEEGLWSPVINGTTKTNGGWYTKIGRQVFVGFNNLTGITAVTNNSTASITGFPFSLTTYDQGGSVAISYNDESDSYKDSLLVGRTTDTTVNFTNRSGNATTTSDPFNMMASYYV